MVLPNLRILDVEKESPMKVAFQPWLFQVGLFSFMEQNNDWSEGSPRWSKEDIMLTFRKVLVTSMAEVWLYNPKVAYNCRSLTWCWGASTSLAWARCVLHSYPYLILKGPDCFLCHRVSSKWDHAITLAWGWNLLNFLGYISVWD